MDSLKYHKIALRGFFKEDGKNNYFEVWEEICNESVQ